MARAIWTGTIGFGLVEIPVSLHAAEERDDLELTQDFAEANVEARRRVEIVEFVDFSAIDPRYLQQPYYLAPNETGRKAYALLREALRRTGKAGIGKVVSSTRQHLSAVVAADNALLLVLLRFSDELRDTSELNLPERNLGKLGVASRELAMAEKLVLGMIAEFKPRRYDDAPPKSYRPPARNVVDLAELLEQSLSNLKKSAKTRAQRGKPPRDDGHKNCA